MIKRIVGVLAVALIAGCGPKGGDAPDAGSGPYIPGFDPPAVPAGYTRLTTPVITNIGPGTDQIWCQWLAGPAAADQDVLDVTGAQSKYGHHVALYATSEQQPGGTTRVCTGGDMESVRFLGAIGAEGSTGIFQKFPPHTVLRLQAGWGLMVNTHFLNTGTETIEGQGVMDVEFTDPSPDHIQAGFFNNVNDAFTIPTGAGQAIDSTCPVKGELDFFMFADHMHILGASIYSEVIRADGSSQMIVQDDPWAAELEFNPTFAVFPSDQLFQVHAGDTIHTHCEYNNTSGNPVKFPTEMCVGLGFFLPVDGGPPPEGDCVDSQWPG